MKLDTEKFKKKLEEEKAKILSELSRDSVHDPKRSSNWEATYPERELGEESIEADPLDAAEEIEEYEERYDLNETAEKRLNAVKAALDKINNGTYGICNTNGKPHEIEEERLEANPAATTCIEHMEE